MKTIVKNSHQGFIALAAVAGSIACAFLACDNSAIGNGSQGDPTPGFNNAGESYDGSTKGGVLPGNPGGGDDASAAPVAVETRCCNLTVSIPDATNDESVHVVRGTFYPLNTEGGVNLTYSAGAWSASVCFPVGSSATYYFDFGAKWLPGFEPEDAGPDDAASADASPDAATDAAMDPDAGLPPGMTRDYRHNDAVASAPSGEFGRVNTFGQVAACTEVDASTGTLPSPPAPPP